MLRYGISHIGNFSELRWHMEHKSSSICSGTSGHSKMQGLGSLFLLFIQCSVFPSQCEATSCSCLLLSALFQRLDWLPDSMVELLPPQDTSSASSLFLLWTRKPDDRDPSSRSDTQAWVHFSDEYTGFMRNLTVFKLDPQTLSFNLPVNTYRTPTNSQRAWWPLTPPPGTCLHDHTHLDPLPSSCVLLQTGMSQLLWRLRSLWCSLRGYG